MNRRAALGLMLAAPSALIITPSSKAVAMEPMAVVIGIGTLVLVGGAIAVVIMCKRAADDNGNWGEGRFNGLDVRFDYNSDISPNTWTNFHNWSSPPNDFRLLVLETGTEAPTLASNEQVAYLPRPTEQRFFRVL